MCLGMLSWATDMPAFDDGRWQTAPVVLQELRRSLDFFRSSGKFTIATMDRGGEKEYFMACACQEIYIPPTANLTLKGFMVAGNSPCSPGTCLNHVLANHVFVHSRRSGYTCHWAFYVWHSFVLWCG